MPDETEQLASVLQRFGCVHKAVHGNGNHVLGRIVLTCEEMLLDRGCTEIHRSSDPSGSILHGTEAVIQGRGGNADCDVYIHTEDRVGVKFARTVLEASEKEGVYTIVVSLEGATPFTKKECDGRDIQFMIARDLFCNVTKHTLVPKHERMEAPPQGIAAEHLPKILETDRIVQYFNWPVGTVVRIWRNFGGHEPVPYFRVVAAACS